MAWLNAILIIIVIGIGSNLDNVTLGIAYGMRRVRIQPWVNGLINLIGFLTALLGALAGTMVGRYITPRDASVSACLVLCLLGIYMLYSAYLSTSFGRRKSTDVRSPGLREALYCGLGLSFTNIASGFGATVSNAAMMWAVVISITVWGYLFIWIGNAIGANFLANFLGKYAAFTGGILMIGIGLHQLT